MERNSFVVGGVIAGGLMVAGAALVIGAGIAKADPVDDMGSGTYGGGHMGDRDAYSFWNQLDQLGQGVSVARAGQVAAQTCTSLASGVSEGRLVSMAVASGIDSEVARLVVHGAEYHFCPDYY